MGISLFSYCRSIFCRNSNFCVFFHLCVNMCVCVLLFVCTAFEELEQWDDMAHSRLACD